VQVALAVAGVQHEARGRLRQLRFDELAPQPYQLRLLIDECAGAAEHLARGDAADLQPRFLQHAVGRHEDPLHLVGVEDLERRPAVD
jgi:hypothetical protein